VDLFMKAKAACLTRAKGLVNSQEETQRHPLPWVATGEREKGEAAEAVAASTAAARVCESAGEGGRAGVTRI